MGYVDCPKTNFRYLVMCYLRANNIEDYDKFDTGFDRVNSRPTITRWEYELEQPTVDYLINDRYLIYKSSIKIMKQEEARETFRQSNHPWVTVIQKIHFNKSIELISLQTLHPELFLPERQTDN